MIPLVAAIVLAGAAGAGPVLVSDACGGDTTDNVDANCAVAEVERIMKARPRPKELKVIISLGCVVPTHWQKFPVLSISSPVLGTASCDVLACIEETRRGIECSLSLCHRYFPSR